MRNINLNKTWIGLVIGILSPFITLMVYYFINYHFMTVRNFINYLKLGDIFTSVISLSVLTNLGVFYLFIWREKYMGAKGVLAATFIWAGYIMYLKFIA